MQTARRGFVVLALLDSVPYGRPVAETAIAEFGPTDSLVSRSSSSSIPSKSTILSSLKIVWCVRQSLEVSGAHRALPTQAEGWSRPRSSAANRNESEGRQPRRRARESIPPKHPMMVVLVRPDDRTADTLEDEAMEEPRSESKIQGTCHIDT